MILPTESLVNESVITIEEVLARIDAMERELQALRQMVMAMPSQRADQTVAHSLVSNSLVDRLWGALGQGTVDELAAYQKDIYLELIDNEPTV